MWDEVREEKIVIICTMWFKKMKENSLPELCELRSCFLKILVHILLMNLKHLLSQSWRFSIADNNLALSSGFEIFNSIRWLSCRSFKSSKVS